MTINELNAKHVGVWEVKSTGNWRSPYNVFHIPSGKRSVCIGIRNLKVAESLMSDFYLNNTSFFRVDADC